MTQSEMNKALATMKILVDTREQPTVQAEARYKQFGLPYERRKLDFGDYSAVCILPDGTEFDISGSVAVERKMSIDELCGCFGKDRGRFTREFDRAKAARAKLHLLVENADFGKVYTHYYRSRLTTPSLIGSILAFSGRYDSQVWFCPPTFSGQFIADILKFEMRERLREI